MFACLVWDFHTVVSYQCRNPMFGGYSWRLHSVNQGCGSGGAGIPHSSGGGGDGGVGLPRWRWRWCWRWQLQVATEPAAVQAVQGEVAGRP